MRTLEDRVHAIIRNNVSPNAAIEDDATLPGLRADDLDIVAIVIDLETEFDIEFEDDDDFFNGKATVADIVSKVRTLAAAAAQS